jgi:DNA polymerase III subunit epsilon
MRRWFARRDRPPDPEDYPAGPVRDLAAAPPPPSRTPVSEVEFLAVDLETTGLDPRRDHVLAIGWVPVTARQVVLAGAREVVVRPPPGVDVGESASVHRLTDDAVAAASTLVGVLPDLLAALHGRVLLAHHAPIELGFLPRAAQEAYGTRLPLTAVDTLTVQHQLVLGQHGEIRPGSLRLDGARRHFGLPRYLAHLALTDAVATGELLLAQVAELEHRLGHEPVLKDLSPIRRR